MAEAFELTDHQWNVIIPLLPTWKTGKRANDPRQVVGGIFWILRTGCPWRDLPDRFGPWQTAYGRFRRWSEKGVWEFLLHQLQQEKGILLDLAFLDGTTSRAHRHAAGAKKGGGPPTIRRTRKRSDGAEAGSPPKST